MWQFESSFMVCRCVLRTRRANCVTSPVSSKFCRQVLDFLGCGLLCVLRQFECSLFCQHTASRVYKSILQHQIHRTQSWRVARLISSKRAIMKIVQQQTKINRICIETICAISRRSLSPLLIAVWFIGYTISSTNHSFCLINGWCRIISMNLKVSAISNSC
jgi:hypothetical protein